MLLILGEYGCGIRLHVEGFLDVTKATAPLAAVANSSCAFKAATPACGRLPYRYLSRSFPMLQAPLNSP